MTQLKCKWEKLLACDVEILISIEEKIFLTIYNRFQWEIFKRFAIFLANNSKDFQTDIIFFNIYFIALRIFFLPFIYQIVLKKIAKNKS